MSNATVQCQRLVQWRVYQLGELTQRQRAWLLSDAVLQETQEPSILARRDRV